MSTLRRYHFRVGKTSCSYDNRADALVVGNALLGTTVPKASLVGCAVAEVSYWSLPGPRLGAMSDLSTFASIDRQMQLFVVYSPAGPEHTHPDLALRLDHRRSVGRARTTNPLPKWLVAVAVEVHDFADGPPRRRSVLPAGPPDGDDAHRVHRPGQAQDPPSDGDVPDRQRLQ